MSSDNQIPKGVASKLAKIGEEIGKISKTGQNKEQGYKFIEYAVLGGKIRPLFAKYGLAFIPSVKEIVRVDEVESQRGKVGYHYILNMEFKIIDADDPSSTIEALWLGEGTDYGDKGINKAETSGTKYFLMRLFNVTEKDEQDADATSPESRVSSTPRNKPWQKYSNNKPTQKQIDWIKDLLKRGGATEEATEAYLKKVTTFEAASKAIDALKKALEDKKSEEAAPMPSDEELENIDFAPMEESA